MHFRKRFQYLVLKTPQAALSGNFIRHLFHSYVQYSTFPHFFQAFLKD